MNETNKDSFIKYMLKPMPLLNIFRSLIYIFFAVMLYNMPNFLNDLPLYKYLFCGAAILYGIYRLYRVYGDFKRTNR